MTCDNINPEVIAHVVTSHVLNFDQIAHGFPVTSPFGLRALTRLKRKHQEAIFALPPEEIQKFVDNELRETGSDVDAAVHITWRHANRLQRFAANREQTPLQRDFVTTDSSQVKWSLVEPAFRASAGLLLSRFATIPPQGEYEPITLPEFTELGAQASIDKKYGHVAVTNLVRYGMSDEQPVISSSSYIFTTVES